MSKLKSGNRAAKADGVAKKGPRPEKLWDNLSGFWSVWLIHMGCDLGLFEAFRQGPLSPEAVAEQKGYEPAYIKVWCSAASSFGYLEGDALSGYRVTPGWGQLLEHYGDWASTYIRLSQRVHESMEAVFRGRAFPESVLSLRLAMTQGLRASYRALWDELAPRVPVFSKALKTGHRVVEYGCGFGLGLQMLKERYVDLELTGVEQDYECAQEAERSTRAFIVTGRPEDATDRNRFDVAVFHRSLNLCEEPLKALDCAVKGLKPGGVLVVISEPEIPESGPLEPRARIRVCERMFFQMFLSEHAMRSITLKQLETWSQSQPLDRIYRDPSPRRGSPCLIWQKRKLRIAGAPEEVKKEKKPKKG
jgi:SAM-dependent methyltransferase